MPLKYVKASLPHLNLLTKILLVLTIMGMSAFGAFAIRMSKGPLDLEFAKPRIEAALSDSSKGYTVSINKLALIWPDMTDAVLLDLNGVKITQENATALNVDNVALGLSGLNLLRGKVLPSVIMIEKPTFQLVQEEGRLRFFWEEEKSSAQKTKELSEEKTEVMTPKKARRSAQDFLSHITNPENSNIDALSALKRLELKQAIITTQANDQESPKPLALVDLSLGKDRVGLEGNLRITLASDGEQKESFLKSDILYRRDQKDVTFTADVQSINPSVFAPYFPDYPILMNQDFNLNGSIQAAFDNNLRLQLAKLNLKVPKGSLNFPKSYDEPIAINDLVFDANLNRPEKTLTLNSFEASVGGINMVGKGEGRFQEGNLITPLKITIAELPLEKVPPVFPKAQAETPAGQWATKKLYDGALRNVVLTTDLNVTRQPESSAREVDLKNTKVTFDIDGVTVQYSDTLMPVKQAKGKGSYENDTLIIEGESGLVGDVKGRNIKLKMTDISVEGGGKADINLDASGPLKTALKYASDEPIAVGDQLGFDVDNVKGIIDFNLQLNFPTVKDLPKEEVEVDIKGVVKDILLPDVVRQLSLTGGPYDLTYDAGLISLKGKGMLAGKPIDLNWEQYLDSTGREYESKITAKITADAALRDAFGIGLEDYMSGPLPVDVTYIDKGVKATIDVKGDLTPTTLHIDPFKYKKPPQTTGALSLKAFMKGDTLEEVDQLALETTGFSLSNGRLIFRKLKDGSTDVARGNFSKAILGKSNVVFDFEITPADVLVAKAEGFIVDLAPFINVEKKPERWNKPDTEDERPMKISVSAKKMLGDEGVSLGASKIYFETNKQSDITRLEMDAETGKGQMYLRFRPEAESGKRTFRLESSDAGHTLKAFGLYDKMAGGSMIIYGQPRGGDLTGDLYGRATIRDFRVKKAPALAKLLGAMSLQGAQNLLRNDGVGFAKLESDFEWQFRENGNLLVMKEGRTSGSSLGLTFEGVANQGDNTMNVSGTIIPVSDVNKAIGDIPLIGNILTGGDALIAATYSLKGAASDPKVLINPLSVLAPGFLRKLFFEQDIETKIRKEEAKENGVVQPETAPELPPSDNNLAQ